MCELMIRQSELWNSDLKDCCNFICDYRINFCIIKKHLTQNRKSFNQFWGLLTRKINIIPIKGLKEFHCPTGSSSPS